MSWENWYQELVSLLAKAEKIDQIAATRYINIDNAKEWYEDGFSPYVCFRENYN